MAICACRIICPEESSPGAHVGILKVMSKVRLEAFMWVSEMHALFIF